MDYLLAWKDRPNRKPLILRGARQVGKTELIRIFAREAFADYLEINFDETPDKKSLFQGDDLSEIIRFLEIDSGKKINPGKTLLFLDEIQSAPAIITKLRYFYEKLPSLHIVCAGSLLEFALSDYNHSIPVGRVEYLYLGPMSFKEFLSATGNPELCDFLNQYRIPDKIPESIHKSLSKHLREFYLTGGMPGVIKQYIASGKDLGIAAMEHASITQTYFEDFGKYRKKADTLLLQRIFRNIPGRIGETVKYTRLDPDTKSLQVKESLELLEKAGLIYRIHHSDGNGVPLRAEQNERYFKLLFLDIGLIHSLLGLKLTDLTWEQDFVTINRGSAAEQFIGQHLFHRKEIYQKPELFYWNRMSKGSSSELDFLIENGPVIIPIEVKAGKTGRLKSLHVFLLEKNSPLGVRFNSEPPSRMITQTSIAGREQKSFTLLSLPLYLVEDLGRLMEGDMDQSYLPPKL
jgi:predicted AAA+ superfamily ATPase